MRKVFHFDSPREKYHCDASVVGCFDNRFEVVCRKLLKRIGVVQPDPIKIAGGAKALASPDEEFHRSFVMEQIHKSIRLHGTDRVILMLHSDCGAYGGLAGCFQGDAAAEADHHRAELRRAAEFLKDALPSLTVDCYFLNFEGAWTVEASSAALA
jgi:carbonic anhydrase